MRHAADDSQGGGFAGRLFERDNACVWHPFTPMRQWMASGDEPGRVIVAGEGFELIDSRGRRFIDGFGSLWCNLHGHRVAKIDDAVRDQLDRIAHSTLLGHASPPSIELADRLVGATPEPLKKGGNNPVPHPLGWMEDAWFPGSPTLKDPP